MHGEVPFLCHLCYFAVVVLKLGLVLEPQPLEEDVGTVNLTITANKPGEVSYNVTISTVAGTAEG